MKILVWNTGTEYVGNSQFPLGVFNTVEERLEIEEQFKKYLREEEFYVYHNYGQVWIDAEIEKILMNLEEIDCEVGKIIQDYVLTD